MRIRISLPENRDYAGRLEVLDASGAVVFGPVPAAGRAHDALAKAHGNASRNPLRLYGDTPLGTYVVRGIVESGAGTGAVLLEPASGQAALADAHGRFRLFIQGGGDDDEGLRATAGGVRIHDRDQQRLASLVRRASGRVLCEVVTTAEQGVKVSLARPPLVGDPPALPGRSHLATRSSGESHAGYAPRMFVMPERSGAGGGTAYGGGGGGAGGGGDLGGGDGTGTGGVDTGPTETGVGPLPITGVDVAPTPGVDLNPSPDDTGTTVDLSGGSQLLTTAGPNGLSSPYSGDQGGWAVGSPVDTTANPTVTDLGQYTGTLQADGTNPNAYTTGQNIDPYSGSQVLLAQNGPVTAPDVVADTTTQTSATGTSTTGGQDTPAPYGAPPSDQSVNSTTLIGLQPIDTVNINGVNWLHYQLSIDGTAYDAYANDKRYPDQAFLVAAGQAPPAGDGSTTTPTDGSSAIQNTPAPTPQTNYTPGPSTGQNYTPGPTPDLSVSTSYPPQNLPDDVNTIPWNPAGPVGAVSSQAYLPNYEARGGVSSFSRNYPNFNVQQNQWQGYLGESSFESNSLLGGALLNDLNTRPWTTATGGQGRPGFFPIFDYQNSVTGETTSVATSTLQSQADRVEFNLFKYREMVGAENAQKLNSAANNLGSTPQDLAENGRLAVNADDVQATRNAVADHIRNNPGDYAAGWDPNTAADHITSHGQTTDMLANQRSARAGLNNLTPDQIKTLMSPEALSVEGRGWGTTVGGSSLRGGGMGALIATTIDAAQILWNPDAHPDAAKELGITAALGFGSSATGAALETTANAQISRSLLTAAANGAEVDGVTAVFGRSLGGGIGGGPAAGLFTLAQMGLSDQHYTAEDYEAKGTRSFAAGAFSGALSAGVVGAIWGTEVPILGNIVGFAVGFGGYLLFDWAFGDDIEGAVRGQDQQLGDFEPADPGGFFTG
jgi:hypothetical protein